MSEFKGTKSPWNIHYTDNERMEISSEEDDRFLDVWGFNSTERMKANALLISKSPELLEMLEETKEALRWYMDNCIPTEKTRNNDEIFFNLGTNLIVNSEQLIKEATTL